MNSKISIAIVGSQLAGKSCIVHRYVHDEFKLLPATLNMASYSVLYNEKRVLLWDTDTEFLNRLSDDFHNCSLLKAVQGIMIVHDITQDLCCYPIVPEVVLKQMKKLNVAVLLVGSKCDLESERVTSYEVYQKFADVHGFVFIEVSAKMGYNINKAFQVLFDIINKRISNHLKLLVRKDMFQIKQISDAVMAQKTLKVRYCKVLVVGTTASGKTNFCCLLLKESFEKVYHSSDLAHTKVSVTKAIIQSTSTPDEVEWVQLGSDTEINYLHSLISVSSESKPLRISMPSEFQLAKLKVNDCKRQSGIFKRLFTSFFKTADKDMDNGDAVESNSFSIHLSAFECMSQSYCSKLNSLNFYDDKVLNIVTLLDTGGQPQYMDLLPVINLSPAVTFVIHRLPIDFDDQVMVQHSRYGKPTFTPYSLNYSNLDMIKLLMATFDDSTERESSCILKTAKPTSIKNSYMCFVGTYVDEVDSDVITAASVKLTAMVDSMKCKTSVWQREDGSVLFTVDNTTAGTSHEDPTIKLIRNRIKDLVVQMNVDELPITWILLNLEIQHICSKRSLSCITFNECFTIARTSGLISDPDEVKNAFRYYHLLGVVLYFENVPGLCDYIITDHQWLFDKLSQVVCLTFQDICNDRSASQRFKYQGLLSKSLLQHMKWEGDIKQEYFLSLLVHMKVIATVFTQEHKIQYFIPFVLPTYNDQQKTKLLLQYGHLKGEPYLIRFKSGLLPRGLFCSLVVQLLQSSTDWHPHFSQGDTHHTFRNLITFNLPNAYSLSLFDKLSCLEIQIRHKESSFNSPGHCEILKRVEHSLKLACKQLNFNYTRLEHGFWCSCDYSIDDHIAFLPTSSSPLQFATCSLNSTQPLPLKPSHLLWLTDKVSSTDNVSSSQSTTNTKLLREVVVQRVAAYWDEVSDYLEYEPEYQHLIRKKCHNDPEECCLELLKDWFSSSRGVSPKSWPMLVSVLRKIQDHATTAEKIAKDLTNAGVAGVKPCENTTI